MRLLVATLLAAGALAGCGGDDEGTSEPTGDPTSLEEREGGGTEVAPDAPEEPGG